MSQAFSDNMAPAWVLQRVMDFLNRAETPAQIKAAVRDDPHQSTGQEAGPDYGIGEVVAQHILNARAALPRKRFTHITELNGISGLGEDKARDLIYSFRISADEAFKKGMYNGVVHQENFDLEYHFKEFATDKDMKLVLDCDSAFTDTVAHLLEDAVDRRLNNRLAAKTAARYLKQCWLEKTASAHQASFYFAYWFYRFDSDNWFSFDRVRQETEKYLEYNWRVEHRLELRFFKGFDQNGLLAEAITVDDLPVVVNYAERRITIWGAGLRD